MYHEKRQKIVPISARGVPGRDEIKYLREEGFEVDSRLAGGILRSQEYEPLNADETVIFVPGTQMPSNIWKIDARPLVSGVAAELIREVPSHVMRKMDVRAIVVVHRPIKVPFVDPETGEETDELCFLSVYQGRQLRGILERNIPGMKKRGIFFAFGAKRVE